MTNKFTTMTAVETFDARVNTDKLTIHGVWKHVTPLSAPKRPDGHCVYQKTPQGNIEWKSTEQPKPQYDISA